MRIETAFVEGHTKQCFLLELSPKFIKFLMENVLHQKYYFVLNQIKNANFPGKK